MSDFPEHDKLSEIATESQAIGGFVDWVSERYGAGFKVWSSSGYSYIPLGVPLRELLAEFFEINEQILENEKRTMLERMRAENAKRV